MSGVDPKPRTMVRFHRRMLWLWIALLPVSYFWQEATPWVVWMSHYAIIVGHWSGWDAARAEQKVDQSDN